MILPLPPTTPETVSEDSAPTAIDVLANDSDPDGGPKSVDSVTQPPNGDVQITGGGSGLSYQPGPEYCNDPDPEPTDDFTYTLNGGSTATVSMTVSCVDDLFTLTVTRRGTGTGAVSSSPAGIDCGATCSHEYVEGTAVELSATADPGSTFAGFSGGNCQYQPTCTVEMSRARNVEATFRVNLHPRRDQARDGAGTVIELACRHRLRHDLLARVRNGHRGRAERDGRPRLHLRRLQRCRLSVPADLPREDEPGPQGRGHVQARTTRSP